MEPRQHIKRYDQEQFLIAIVLPHELIPLRDQVQNPHVVVGVDVGDEDYPDAKEDLVDVLWAVVVEELVVGALAAV